jgi:DNA replication ATP-dependent helicase Dna2
VDRFQGDERDIIIFSLTLIDENIPELLQDRRRLNVAISRARKKFIGVGNWDIVDGSDTLKHLKYYVEQSEQGCIINEINYQGQ